MYVSMYVCKTFTILHTLKRAYYKRIKIHRVLEGRTEWGRPPSALLQCQRQCQWAYAFVNLCSLCRLYYTSSPESASNITCLHAYKYMYIWVFLSISLWHNQQQPGGKSLVKDLNKIYNYASIGKQCQDRKLLTLAGSTHTKQYQITVVMVGRVEVGRSRSSTYELMCVYVCIW